MTYAEKLKDPRWHKVRKAVKTRDGFKCRDCPPEKPSRPDLQVHHCHYESGDPWETAIALLLSLCRQCHKNRQSLENRIRLLLGVIFAQVDLTKNNEEMNIISRALNGAMEEIKKKRRKS